jgi:hypothetical protein
MSSSKHKIEYLLSFDNVPMAPMVFPPPSQVVEVQKWMFKKGEVPMGPIRRRHSTADFASDVVRELRTRAYTDLIAQSKDEKRILCSFDVSCKKIVKGKGNLR